MSTPAVPPFIGSLQELRDRWSEIRPGRAHEARLVAFDADGTLHLGVRGHVSSGRREHIEFAVQCAIAVLDGIAVRRVICRKVTWPMWESL